MLASGFQPRAAKAIATTRPSAQSFTNAQIRNPTLDILPGNSNSALLIADRLHWQSAWRAQSPNIPHGWLAEEAAVFAIELAGAFIADFKGRTGGVEAVDKHACSRGLQSNLLLILKRTHGRQRPEMVV
jgi:hypothetical protein